MVEKKEEPRMLRVGREQNGCMAEPAASHWVSTLKAISSGAELLRRLRYLMRGYWFGVSKTRDQNHGNRAPVYIFTLEVGWSRRAEYLTPWYATDVERAKHSGEE